MKKVKFFMLSLLIILLAACGGKKPAETPPVEEMDMVVEEVVVEEPIEVIDVEGIPEDIEEGIDQVEKDMAQDLEEAEKER